MRILYLGTNLDNFYDASLKYLFNELARKQNLIAYGTKYIYRNKFIPDLNFVGNRFISNVYPKLNSILKSRSKYNIETDVFKITKNEDPDVILVESLFPSKPSLVWKNLDKIKS